MKIVALVVATVLCIGVSAQAQVPRMGGVPMGSSDNPVGPTVSPYLNLLQSNQGVTNYQSLVRPLIENRSAIARQGNSIQQLQQQVNNPTARGAGGIRATGHTTFFMNTSHYFPATR